MIKPNNPIYRFILFLFVYPCFLSSAQTPFDLASGISNMTPAEYYALSQKANQAYTQKDYKTATAAYQQLTTAYPYDGETMFLYGLSLYADKQFLKAGRAFESAYTLGTPGELWNGSAVYAARAFVQANEHTLALQWLEKSLLQHQYAGTSYDILNESIFQPLANNPLFLKLTAPKVADYISRLKGWNIDLEYLLTQIKRFNPNYSQPAIKVKVDSVSIALRKRLAKLTDVQVAVEMQKMVALLNASHTELFLHRQPKRFSFSEPLPINLWVFPEGLYIVEAEEAYNFLIGSRITAIEGMPIETVIEKLRPLVGQEGEPMRAIMPRFLILPHVLHAMGIAKSVDKIRLTVLNKEGQSSVHEVTAKPKHQWRDILLPSPLAKAPAPLYMKSPKEIFWLETLPNERAMYMRLKMMRNKQEETLEAFGLRLKQSLEQTPEIKHLIIDLRGNTGGNTFLYSELLRSIIQFDAIRGNKIFVLIDRAVYSAATNFAVELDRLTNAVFIGELIGGQPQLNGDAINFLLPYSGLFTIISTVKWNLSSPYESRVWIAPDVPVALSASDYFDNQDPVLETTFDLIKKSRNQ